MTWKQLLERAQKLDRLYLAHDAACREWFACRGSRKEKERLRLRAARLGRRYEAYRDRRP